MSLNIKNEEACDLARELSNLTGESMTTAITRALKERIERVKKQKGQSLSARLQTIGKDCAKRLKEPYKSADHGELLYDEKGLP